MCSNLCLRRQNKIFFFGIVILEGHLSPQRLHSLNFTQTNRVQTRVCSRPQVQFFWLKLPIKMVRQSKFIQTKIKQRVTHWRRLCSVEYIWMWEVCVVTFIKPVFQSFSPEFPSSINQDIQRWWVFQHLPCIMWNKNTLLLIKGKSFKSLCFARISSKIIKWNGSQRKSVMQSTLKTNSHRIHTRGYKDEGKIPAFSIY